MSFGLDNPRRPGDDIQVRGSLGIWFVKPVSARGREWFQKSTGSVERQIVVERRGEDVFTALIDGFEQLKLQVVINPPSNTTKIRKIVSERLSHWRKSQIVM